MSKEMGIIGLGLFVVVVPYLGIPGSWKTVLFVAAGLLIALMGFLLRGAVLSQSHSGATKRQTTESHPFVESSEAE